MLEVGNGGMSYLEDQAHFVLWSVLKSPLLIGCDIVNIASETLEILSNEEVIAVNQDKLSKQAHRFKRDSGVKGFRDYYAGELT
jgi:alpha-galactosidase